MRGWALRQRYGHAKIARPSAEQATVLRKLVEDPLHRLKRLPGGFWVTPSTPMTGRVLAPSRFDAGGAVPAWYTGTQTMHAMERRGWIQRVRVHPEEWRDERELTDVGRAALEAVS